MPSTTCIIPGYNSFLGIIEHNGQQEPDRGTAVYENLVIFRK